MPLHWTVSHEEELVHAIATGELNTDDLQAYLGAIIAAQAMPYGKIFDMSKATSLAGASRLSEVADTVRLYAKMKLGTIGPLAIVAVTDDGIANAQAFIRGASAERPVRLFADGEQARAWIIGLRAAPA